MRRVFAYIVEFRVMKSRIPGPPTSVLDVSEYRQMKASTILQPTGMTILHEGLHGDIRASVSAEVANIDLQGLARNSCLLQCCSEL